MCAGRMRVLQQTDPRKVRLDYGKPLWRDHQREVYRNNPRIAAPDDLEVDVQVYRPRGTNGLRPYHVSKTMERWGYNLSFRPEVGELYFDDEEKALAKNYPRCVVINSNVKGNASPNKNWGAQRWRRFIELASAEGYELAHLGPSMTDHRILNLVTGSFRKACIALSSALAYVGHEGGMHHAAAALGIPGVVIFGGFTPVELTGYHMHRNLGVSLGDACGMRVRCEHCEAEMEKITPEQVLSELKAVLGG